MSAAGSLPLSELTPAGKSAFRELLADTPGLSIRQLEERIRRIASEPATSGVIEEKIAVPLFPDLSTRHDTAMLTRQILDAAQLEAGPTDGRDLVFSWLALVFLPALCRRNKEGRAVGGMMYRYVLTRTTRDFYRHLVACPYWLHRKYGTHARIFNCQPAHVMPDVVEQVASRPNLIESEAVVEVIDRLYWDASRDSPKTGFTSTKVPEIQSPGSARRIPEPGTLRALEMTLGQLQCTYDLRSMNADQILGKLPAEFDAWRDGSPAR